LKIFRDSFESFFNWSAHIVIEKWYFILLLAIMLTLFSASFLNKIALETDIMSLLPSDDMVVKDFVETSRIFGSSEKLIVLIELTPALPKREVLFFMRSFAKLLEEAPVVKTVEYKIPHINLDDSKKRMEDKFDISYSFYATEKEDSFLMFIAPLGSSGDIKFCQQLMEAVKKIEHKAKKECNIGTKALTIKYTGGYAITLHEARNMEKNVKITLFTSLIGILFLFFLSFRRISMVLFVSIPLVMAIFWTLAITYFTISSLNVITVAFAAILAGLGIDFAIHISNRFALECLRGAPIVDAARTSIIHTGKGIFFGCVTTSIAFYSLLFTGFKNVAEFGFLVGTGLILCMLAMLFVLPSLLIMRMRAYREKGSEYTTLFFDLRRTAIFVQRHGKSMSIFLILAWIILGFLIFPKYGFVKFDNRLDNMSAANNPAVKVQHRILESFGNAIEPVSLVAKDKNPQQALELIRRTIPLTNELIKGGYLVRTENLFKYLPSTVNYKAFLKKISGVNKEKALDYFIGRLKEDRSKKEEYQFFLEKKKYILGILGKRDSDKMIGYYEMKNLIPEALLEKFFAKDRGSGNFCAVNYLYPRQRITSREDAEEVRDYFGVDGARLRISGMGIMIGRLEHLVRKEFKFIVIFVSAVLILILTIVYRNISFVLISTLSLLMGVTGTILCMLVFDIKLNYINVIAFPLIIGMGIDDSIHMLHRYLENGECSIKSMIETTGRAVLLTSLTTMIGFGSLIFTGHNGLMSLGILASIGIGFCLLTSLFVLPGLIVIMREGVV